ncbi:MAG: AAA family ATPase [Zoogloeaceae bacterium]|nr:AAA family ATPase [Zoogloeaceae bacterium]
MADFDLDQAAGLRRLLTRHQLRILTFASGTSGAGQTTLAANLAVELARQGQEVLLIDENGGRNLSAFFGRRAAGDLLQTLRRQRALEEVLFSPTPGLRILPAARAARSMTRLSADERDAFLGGLAALSCPVEVLLIDSSPEHAQGLSPWGLAAGEAVMVVTGAKGSITDTYALIRKVSQAAARRQFRILVNRVKRAEDGLLIFNNLKQLAAQKGIARLEYGGAIPVDSAFRELEKLCQPLTEVLPDHPAATALRRFADRLYSWPDAGYDSGGVEHFVAHLLHSASLPIPHALNA